MLSAAAAALGGLACSWLLEAALAPRPRAPWRRPAACAGLHAGLWLLALAGAFALTRRPGFAAAAVLAFVVLLVAVNNAKYAALREPFVWADFEYFTDALRHPRLYLPFLGAGRAALAAAAAVAAVWAGLAWETPLAWADAAPAALAMAGTGAILLARSAPRLPPMRLRARPDLRRYGLCASLWAYARREREPGPAPRTPFSGAPENGAVPAPAPALSARLPDLVAVQSESFFDARRVYPQLRAEVLAAFDALRAQACAYGALQVASWGANTVRTEFSFLTGLGPREQGVHRYQPYRRLARKGPATVASYLRGLGYRTVCVHPYHGSFYGRDRVLPLLGFDEFVDLTAFDASQAQGPYVGDLAVADYVRGRLLAGRDQPLYVHVITMENHGPLHWEAVDAADRARVCRQALPEGCDDLVAYARHLRNADAMFARLAETLAALPRPGGLCVYGDHVPIMPGVYRRLGAPPGDTDYLIWRSGGGAGAAAQAPLPAERLARAFLAHMGLMPGG